MKLLAALTATVLFFSPAPALTAGQTDYLTMEESLRDQWVEYSYCYPQITGEDNRAFRQRINHLLREYSQSTAQDARLAAKQSHSALTGETDFWVQRNDRNFFSLTFHSRRSDGISHQKGFVFSPQTGMALRLEELFTGKDWESCLKNISSQWREEQGLGAFSAATQDFYLTGSELVLLSSAPNKKNTLSFSIPLEDLSGLLKETVLSS